MSFLAADVDERARPRGATEAPRSEDMSDPAAGTRPVGAAAVAWSSAACRTLDVMVAVAVVVLGAPLILLIACAILVESPGPLFYRAERVGRHGRPLRMLKFRKMRPGASGLPLTVAGDARLTRVGALLLKFRLDELPQLWHVLRGEMSLVGPRPEDPRFVAVRRADFETILTVPPGITGLSQLAFADEGRLLVRADPVGHYVERLLPQKCELDRLYVARRSVSMNLRILLWTILTVGARRPVAVDRSTAALRVRRRPSLGGPARAESMR